MCVCLCTHLCRVCLHEQRIACLSIMTLIKQINLANTPLHCGMDHLQYQDTLCLWVWPPQVCTLTFPPWAVNISVCVCQCLFHLWFLRGVECNTHQDNSSKDERRRSVGEIGRKMGKKLLAACVLDELQQEDLKRHFTCRVSHEWTFQNWLNKWVKFSFIFLPPPLSQTFVCWRWWRLFHSVPIWLQSFGSSLETVSVWKGVKRGWENER